MKFVLIGFILLVSITSGMSQERMIVADGTRSQIGSFYLLEAERKAVEQAIRLGSFEHPLPASPAPCGETVLAVKDVADGTFSGKKARAMLYWRCAPDAGGLISGIIVLAKRTIVAHAEFAFASETKLAAVRDLDGDGNDELALYSFTELDERRANSVVRLLRVHTGSIEPLGTASIHRSESADGASFNFSGRKLFADPGPNYFVQEFTLHNAPLDTVFDEKKLAAAGKRWEPAGTPVRITLDPDGTKYLARRWRFGIVDAASAIMTAACALFLMLVPAAIWAFFRSRQFREAKERTNKDPKQARHEAAEPDARLVPLKCPNCGAGVPLGLTMICEGCGTPVEVPREYSEAARLRSLTTARLARAESYFGWARILTSGPFVGAVSLAMTVIAAALLVLFFVPASGSFIYYKVFFANGLFGFAVLAGFYWLFTLLLFFPVRSVKARSFIPTIGLATNAATELGSCSQCGGAIRFAGASVAAVCGYCGVETYRAQVAWEHRQLANEAFGRAAFSLIDAARLYSETVSNILYTPLAVMLVLLIPAATCALSAVFY